MSLELRHLAALVAVADAGTISRAAEHLGYTQSAISQQVAALERAVGAPVFERPGGPRPLRLTEAGAALLGHARDVLAMVRGAEADVRAIADGERGRLRVGTIQSVGTRVLPEVLRRFGTVRPGVDVVLQESHDTTDLLDLLDDGELDVTFALEPLRQGPWESEAVLDDPWVLLAPAGSALAGRPSVAVAELADLPFIGQRNPVCLSLTVAAFGPDVAPRFVFHSDDNTTIQGCVGAGLGYALVPLLTVDPDDPATVVVALEPSPPPRVVLLASRADRRRPPTLDAFVDVVRDVCAGLVASSPSAAA